MQGMEGRVQPLCLTNNVVGSARAVTLPPYHVAMTRSSSRLTLSHGHRAPPLPCIKEMFVEVLSNHFDVSDNSTMANYAMKLQGNVMTDMVDGYICTKSISAAMASFNFDVFGQ
jgi:hypothetical protein